jgi:SAM-dependent methyltransferase
MNSAILPPEFDPALYRTRYPDVTKLDALELEQHYKVTGIPEGRNASGIVTRAAFVELIPKESSLLEVGPFANPFIRGPNVKYFDVFSTQEVRRLATTLGLDPGVCPDITFVSETGDFKAVTGVFEAVLSSHVIEHQPDLIAHLQGAASVLGQDGYLYLAIPDKRYCFDHYLAESSIAEVVAAHFRSQQAHDISSVIETRVLTTHNDPQRHWAGDHGESNYKAKPEIIRDAVDFFLASQGKYIDVHAWQFVPESFRDVMQTLFELRLSPFELLKTYPTPVGSNEFYAVLKKSTQQFVALGKELPLDFDEHQYLLANPDVARAGVDATQHYLNFGRREGRKLR